MSILNGDDVDLMGRKGRKFGRILAAIATGGLSSKKFRRGFAAVSTGGMSEVANRLRKRAKANKAVSGAVGSAYKDAGAVAPEYQDEVGGMDSGSEAVNYNEPYQPSSTIDLPYEENTGEAQGELETAEMSGDKKKLFLYAGLGVVGAYMLYKTIAKSKKRK